ncbi:hypothetical protein Tco_0059809 [Tanacetum coccineum]
MDIFHVGNSLRCLGQTSVLSWFVLEVLFDVACIVRFRPKGSIVEGYATEEVVEVCTDYLKGIDNIGIPRSRHEGKLLGVVILFGVISAIIPVIPAKVLIIPADPLVAPEVGAISITSPARVLDLVDYSSFDSNPSEDSLPPAPELPLVSPFMCSDDSEVNSESQPAEQRPERHESLTVHDVIVSRWRDKVTSRPSLPSGSSSDDIFAPSSEFPIAPIVAPPRIHRRTVILIRLDLTLDSFSSGSSSDSSSDTFSGSPSNSLSDTSSVYSSGYDASGQTHSGPSTRVASSSLIPYYFSTIIYSYFEIDSPYFCWSFTTSQEVQRFILTEDSREEHMEIGTTNAEAVADLGIGDGVGVDTEDCIGIGVEITVSDIREDEEEFEAEASARGMMEIAVGPFVTGDIFESTSGDAPDLEGIFYDIVHYMSEVPLDMITKFETA